MQTLENIAHLYNNWRKTHETSTESAHEIVMDIGQHIIQGYHSHQVENEALDHLVKIIICMFRLVDLCDAYQALTRVENPLDKHTNWSIRHINTAKEFYLLLYKEHMEIFNLVGIEGSLNNIDTEIQFFLKQIFTFADEKKINIYESISSHIYKQIISYTPEKTGI